MQQQSQQSGAFPPTHTHTHTPRKTKKKKLKSKKKLLKKNK